MHDKYIFWRAKGIYFLYIIGLLLALSCKKNAEEASVIDDSTLPQIPLKRVVAFREGSGSIWGYDILATKDNNLIASFHKDGQNVAYVIKYNLDFDTIWRVTIPGKEIKKLCETATGDIIGYGVSNIVKIHADGSGWEDLVLSAKPNKYYKVFKTSDDGFYVVGYDNVANKSCLNKYNSQFSLTWNTKFNGIREESISIDFNDRVIGQGEYSNALYIITPSGKPTEIININYQETLDINSILSEGNDFILAASIGKVFSGYTGMFTASINKSGSINWECIREQSFTNVFNVNNIIKLNGKYFMSGNSSLHPPFSHRDILMLAINTSGQLTDITIFDSLDDSSISSMCKLNNHIYAVGGEYINGEVHAVIYKY